MRALEQAISLVPVNPWFLREQAFLLYTLDELDAALGRIDQAIALEPEEGSFFETRSLILWKMGDIDAALDIGVDYIILDGRGGGTGAAPLIFRDNISVPTIPGVTKFAKLQRGQRDRHQAGARRDLHVEGSLIGDRCDEHGRRGVGDEAGGQRG